MDWKITSVIKGKTKDGEWYSNLVGTLKTNRGDEFIYKISRLPSFRGYWEFFISLQLEKKLGGVPHFSRVVDVQMLMLDVDEHGKSIATAKTKRQKMRCVTLQRIVYGLSLAKHIEMGSGEGFAIRIVFQILCAISMAQREIRFTHRDLHANNILLEKEQLESGIRSFYLYEVGKKRILVPSDGFRAKIIDYEFSFVKDVKGKPFDSRLDLIKCCYIPCVFDKSYDTLRLTISLLAYLRDHNASELCRITLQDILQTVNKSVSVKFNSDGVIEDTKDSVEEEVRSKTKNEHVLLLIRSRYYFLLGLLLHHVTIPFREIIKGDRSEMIDRILEFFHCLIEFSKDPDRCCIVTYEYICGENPFASMMDDFWVSKFGFMLQTAADAFQSLYKKEIQEKQKMCKPKENTIHTPIKMLRFLQSRFPAKINIVNRDIVYHVTTQSCNKIVLQLPDDQLDKLNAIDNMIKRGRILYGLLFPIKK